MTLRVRRDKLQSKNLAALMHNVIVIQPRTTKAKFAGSARGRRGSLGVRPAAGGDGRMCKHGYVTATSCSVLAALLSRLRIRILYKMRYYCPALWWFWCACSMAGKGRACALQSLIAWSNWTHGGTGPEGPRPNREP